MVVILLNLTYKYVNNIYKSFKMSRNNDLRARAHALWSHAYAWKKNLHASFQQKFYTV